MHHLALPAATLACLALGAPAAHADTIQANSALEATGTHVSAAFDILEASITRDEDEVFFRIKLRGDGGEEKPTPKGNLIGSSIFAYAWPTTLDSGDVGFDPDLGFATLALTFHPDFDDQGLSNRDTWHAHWLVLEEDDSCGAGYRVHESATETGVPQPDARLPLSFRTPDYPVSVSEEQVEVVVPASDLPNAPGTNFDGITMRLDIGVEGQGPLICASTLLDIASGNFSLPGEVK